MLNFERDQRAALGPPVPASGPSREMSWVEPDGGFLASFSIGEVAAERAFRDRMHQEISAAEYAAEWAAEKARRALRILHFERDQRAALGPRKSHASPPLVAPPVLASCTSPICLDCGKGFAVSKYIRDRLADGSYLEPPKRCCRCRTDRGLLFKGVSACYQAGVAAASPMSPGPATPRRSLDSVFARAAGTHPTPSSAGADAYQGTRLTPSSAGADAYQGARLAPSSAGADAYQGTRLTPSSAGAGAYPGARLTPSSAGADAYPTAAMARATAQAAASREQAASARAAEARASLEAEARARRNAAVAEDARLRAFRAGEELHDFLAAKWNMDRNTQAQLRGLIEQQRVIDEVRNKEKRAARLATQRAKKAKQAAGRDELRRVKQAAKQAEAESRLAAAHPSLQGEHPSMWAKRYA